MSPNRALDASEVGRPPELPLSPEPLEVRDRLALLPASAQRALSLGLNAVDPSFHVFVSVAPEVHLERDLLSAIARLPLRRPPALDVVYVPDFDAPDQPIPILLPAGMGIDLAESLSQLVRDVRRRLEAMSLDTELRETDRKLSKDLDRRSKEVLSGVETRAKELGFGVRNVQGSFRTFPILHGKPVSAEQFDVLDDRTRRALTEAEEQLSAAVEEAAAKVNNLTDEVEKARDEIAQKIADRAVSELLTPLLERYASNPTVSSFLERVGDELAHDWQELFPADPARPRLTRPRSSVGIV
ncbi:MAG: Lon-like protease helical domain-containing protein [Polyangiaceae bacterium]